MCGNVPAPTAENASTWNPCASMPRKPCALAEFDVVVDRVVVAGEHLERREMRLRHGAARIAVDLADFQIVEAARLGHVERSSDRTPPRRPVLAFIVGGILACGARRRKCAPRSHAPGHPCIRAAAHRGLPHRQGRALAPGAAAHAVRGARLGQRRPARAWAGRGLFRRRPDHRACRAEAGATLWRWELSDPRQPAAKPRRQSSLRGQSSRPRSNACPTGTCSGAATAWRSRQADAPICTAIRGPASAA